MCSLIPILLGLCPAPPYLAFQSSMERSLPSISRHKNTSPIVMIHPLPCDPSWSACQPARCSLIYSHPPSSLLHSSFVLFVVSLSLSVSLVTLVIHSFSSCLHRHLDTVVSIPDTHSFSLNFSKMVPHRTSRTLSSVGKGLGMALSPNHPSPSRLSHQRST